VIDSSAFVLAAPGRLEALLCVLVVAIPIGLMIGAVVLRAAVSLFNKFAGTSEVDETGESFGLVPEPSMLKAVGILLITGVANFMIGLILSVLASVVGLLQAGPEGLNPGNQIILNLASLPFTFIVSSALLSALLPTTFKRGMGVALCQYIVSILLGLVIGLIVIIVGLALG